MRRLTKAPSASNVIIMHERVDKVPEVLDFVSQVHPRNDPTRTLVSRTWIE